MTYDDKPIKPPIFRKSGRIRWPFKFMRVGEVITFDSDFADKALGAIASYTFYNPGVKFGRTRTREGYLVVRRIE